LDFFGIFTIFITKKNANLWQKSEQKKQIQILQTKKQIFPLLGQKKQIFPLSGQKSLSEPLLSLEADPLKFW
jgi:hypothetical protein